MKKTYSLYEAKARFSEIIRQVRERNATVTVSYHGKPVAEIRPVDRAAAGAIEQRLGELEARGALIRSARRPHFPRVAKRPGALARFLEDRD